MSFDLGAMLADVSKSDTREQIEYIPLENLESDPRNFYQLSGVEDLASNIALCGVQQPIRVRPGQNGHYIIVSGHRRRAALESLAKEDPQRWKEVPCIVERDSVSPALQQLRLIYANANTRTMTSAEVIQQAEQVEKLLYQLKEEGFDFPGRMRDHVAQAVQVSTSKLARLKVIRENLAEEWRPAFQEDKLKESTAYELAKMPEAWQRIFWEANKKDIRSLYADSVKRKAAALNKLTEMECSKGHSQCVNLDNMLRKTAGAESWLTPCTGCCLECSNLRTCSFSCIHAAKKKQELKAQAKEEKRAAAEQKEQKDRPVIEYIQGVYTRIGQLRKEHGVSVEQLYKAAKIFYGKPDDAKEKNLETGKAAISANDHLPFHYGFTDTNAKALCAVADLLHCSVDYLLGRSSDPEQASMWHTGEPLYVGEYVTFFKLMPTANPWLVDLTWNGSEWCTGGGPLTDKEMQVVLWTEKPEVE